MSEKKDNTPRGVRNCNPGNIRLPRKENMEKDRFIGELRPSRDKSFRTFVNMAYGYRAIFRILRTYKNSYQLNTLEQMIYRWAPPTDNNKTEVYVDFVADRAGIGRKDIVDVSNMTVMCRIVEAMATMECGGKTGWVPDMNEIRDGWVLL
ncbi:MAG: structural protein P5 [bacterium]|nr:structural protein P5 [bacterium]